MSLYGRVFGFIGGALMAAFSCGMWLVNLLTFGAIYRHMDSISGPRRPLTLSERTSGRYDP